MIKTLFTAIAFLLLTAYTHAQVVKGKVVDAATGNPIAQASVYLKALSKGTTSNARGEFVLYTNETKIPLIISSIGYQPDTIDNYNGKTLIIKLSPRAQVLREVVIGGKNREKYMKIFLTEFIGSHNKDCIISNPEVIKFTYHKETRILEAKVNQPLIIQNKKLGYKITYFLTAFSHSLTELETSYKGNYVFADDTLGLTPTEIKEIRKARDKAYYGSRMHFIRSVWADDLKKNKFFYLYTNLYDLRINFIFNNIINASKEQLLNNIFTKIINPIGYFWYLPVTSIVYNGVDKSDVTFQSGTKNVVINANSYNESNLLWSGKMGEQRVRDLLPVDFEPSEPLSK